MVTLARRDASVYDLQNLKTVWLALHISGGQVGLPLIVLALIILPRRREKITLINFCMTWIVYSIVYCLLLYSKQEDMDIEAPTTLCLAQASLIHGAPPMAAVAGFELVLQLWCIQRRIHSSDIWLLRNIPRWLLVLLVIMAPYIAFVGFSILMLAHGLHDEKLVLSANHIYCTSQSYLFSLIVPVFCALLMAGIICIEGLMYYNWYKTRREVQESFDQVSFSEFSGITKQYQRRTLSFSMSLRATLFTLYCVAALSACIVFVSKMANAFPYMVEASLPLAAFLIFGCQKDIIRLYFCWSRQQRPTVAITDEKSIPTARPTIRPTIESILVPSPEPSIATTPISPHSHIALSHSNELRRVTGDYMV